MLIISNGYGKFHLSVLAAEFCAQGRLDYFLTGAYPKGALRDLLLKLPLRGSGRLQRLLQRKEGLDETKIESLWQPEMLYHSSRLLARRPGQLQNAQALQAVSYSRYGSAAARFLANHGAKGIYHYRAGYGGNSVRMAKDLGMIALCDHSIAHPQVLEYMIDHKGAYPTQELPQPANPVERWILADILAADHVLVNSDFVKKTFSVQGFDEGRVSVVYLGVDEQFVNAIPTRSDSDRSGRVRLLFAGGFNARKGATDVARAMNAIGNGSWSFAVASNIDSVHSDEERLFLSNAKVRKLGFLSRAALAAEMAATDIFVFPSLAEGSARVVFEALAAGCYVIVTENTGSIVRHGVHGAIVEPGNPDALQEAIAHAIAHPEMVAEIGRANAELVRDRYRQWHYSANVWELYSRLGHGGTTPLPSTSG